MHSQASRDIMAGLPSARCEKSLDSASGVSSTSLPCSSTLCWSVKAFGSEGWWSIGNLSSARSSWSTPIETSGCSIPSSSRPLAPTFPPSPLLSAGPSGFTASGGATSKSGSFTSLSAVLKKLRNSTLLTCPSESASTRRNSSSSVSLLTRWLCHTTRAAALSRRWNSAVCFLPACLRNLQERFVARARRELIRPMRISRCLASKARKALRSAAYRASKPSAKPSICLRAPPTTPRASSIMASVESAMAMISGTAVARTLEPRGWTCFSTLATLSSASSTSLTTSLTLPTRPSFSSLSTASYSLRTTRRLASRWRSRATPMAMLSRWNPPSPTPLWPSSTIWRQMPSRASSGRTKPKYPRA
mmetsp:Transcript_37365/g.111609  ORF Transcript_37365/g.111609 Transcript_37365/m.111609 type:complete len:361 (-) Transcript_37365:429-1511(-)